MNLLKGLLQNQTTLAKTIRMILYFVLAITVVSLQDPTIKDVLFHWFPGLTIKLGSILTAITLVKNLLDPTVKNI